MEFVHFLGFQTNAVKEASKQLHPQGRQHIAANFAYRRGKSCKDLRRSGWLLTFALVRQHSSAVYLTGGPENKHKQA